MSSLSDRISALATAAGANDKAIKLLLNGNAADLSALTTATKTNLVAALNEVRTTALGLILDTAASTDTTHTYSAQKTVNLINAAVAGVVNSSPSTLDTLKELADALGDDPNFATTMTTALGNRLRVDVNNQGLTSTQQLNGRTNLDVYGTADIGTPDTDFASAFNAALT